MKKILIVALALVASASFNTTLASGKKEKKNKATQQIETTIRPQLLTPTDSLSYAGGMTMTQGLIPYLQQQFGVTEDQLPDVIRGFEDASSHRNDSTFMAYMAGQQVMSMVKSRMIPGMTEELGTINDNYVYAGFADARLTADSQTTIQGALDFRADDFGRLFLWSNGILAEYGKNTIKQ